MKQNIHLSDKLEFLSTTTTIWKPSSQVKAEFGTLQEPTSDSNCHTIFRGEIGVQQKIKPTSKTRYSHRTLQRFWVQAITAIVDRKGMVPQQAGSVRYTDTNKTISKNKIKLSH